MAEIVIEHVFLVKLKKEKIMKKGELDMNHRPHYPPPAPYQENNDPLGQDLHAGAEIVMIFVAIYGIWKYIVVPLWESVIVPLWNW